MASAQWGFHIGTRTRARETESERGPIEVQIAL